MLSSAAGPAPYLHTDVWRGTLVATLKKCPMHINGKALGFICSAFVLPGYSTQK